MHVTLDTAAAFVVLLLGIHTLIKFAFFFALPYTKRRAMLDHSYGDRPSATQSSDPVLLAMAIALGALLLWRGSDAVSLLGGFWIGATLVQLYFHRFKAPLPPDRTPPPVVSPIKTMSYAIQAAPQRAWRELVTMSILVLACVVLVVRGLR